MQLLTRMMIAPLYSSYWRKPLERASRRQWLVRTLMRLNLSPSQFPHCLMKHLRALAVLATRQFLVMTVLGSNAVLHPHCHAVSLLRTLRRVEQRLTDRVGGTDPRLFAIDMIGLLRMIRRR
ncbi:hypothetical protein BCR44DRAFT_1437877 [Catenaria anguillulae PL171]|uniref:Uncharacterized protein n=1 Tax=Catenaria anguillulae PL171 TaxID=765915 RepID=A0A1Y2HGC0_9FUNG|nr:hypothetical protein BCR44DRAFT_1437877 [Catenaria anguillulae PL171]